MAEPQKPAPERILDAATRVFAAKGFAAANTDEVAAAAGVSKGLVFRYFATKERLLQALIERWLGEAFAFWDAEPWEGEPAVQLGRIFDVVLGRVRGDPDGHRLYLSLMNQPTESKVVAEAVSALRPQVTAYYARLGRLMVQLGSEEPALDAKLFQFALNGLVQAIVADPGVLDRPDILPLDDVKRRLLARFTPASP
jgi:AcrR family transcriptional regulator